MLKIKKKYIKCGDFVLLGKNIAGILSQLTKSRGFCPQGILSAGDSVLEPVCTHRTGFSRKHKNTRQCVTFNQMVIQCNFQLQNKEQRNYVGVYKHKYIILWVNKVHSLLKRKSVDRSLVAIYLIYSSTNSTIMNIYLTIFRY